MAAYIYIKGGEICGFKTINKTKTITKILFVQRMTHNYTKNKRERERDMECIPDHQYYSQNYYYVVVLASCCYYSSLKKEASQVES